MANEREHWLQYVYENFKCIPVHKEYFKITLEILWPPGTELPGPEIKLDIIRSAIDDYRRLNGQYQGTPYSDVAKRMRELMGDEALLGLQKRGNAKSIRYQLLNTEIGTRRLPRKALNKTLWQGILNSSENKCAVCQIDLDKAAGINKDHKIPRTRGGSDNLDNLQALCSECNLFKRLSCRNCILDCQICGWAFPDKFAPLRLSNHDLLELRELAVQRGISINELIREMIDNYLT
ncbi:MULTISPECIES: HNH endonuclease [Nostocales]|uniref:HNH endonuclease n=1 Tax=Dolichospermum flos-aquae UHCC 0037 TaxID=2590026 RepID=A0ACC7SC42_DOLFA|nr:MULTISPECIES: HNH endonuclease [Nostocales]MBO1066191.1 HNH endonuclease [Anabaena sp. 54]MTJ45776.1 HNH endonuclease [Dolichospermum flos-aquae UHCC 0037]